MTDRYNLGGNATGSAPVSRWLGFLLALATGMFIGFQLWQDPAWEDANPKGATPKGAIPVVPSPRTTILVPDQGRLTDRLNKGVRVGSAAPEFTLTDLNGEVHSFSRHTGSVVLINFWTTWCPPCEYEMPALQQAYRMYKDSGFTILAVNWAQQDDPEQVGPYVQTLGLTFPVLLDIQGVVSENIFNIRGLPTSVIVDREGIVREIIIGPMELEGIGLKIQTYLEE